MKLPVYLKHERFLDTCIYAYHMEDKGEGVLVKGVWVNQGFKRSWSINETFEHVIPKAKLHEWSYYNRLNLSSLRHADWQPIGEL